MKEVYESKLGRLMVLALQVNMKTPMCVFTDNSGHVDWVNFRFCPSKTDYQKTVKEFTFRYQSNTREMDEDDYEYNFQQAEKLEEYLDKILAGDFPVSYEATLDFGVTTLRKSFETIEARDNWVIEQKAKCKIPPEVIYNEEKIYE